MLNTTPMMLRPSRALAPSVRRARSLFLAASVLGASALAVVATACATGDGATLYGQEIGPIPPLPDASRDGAPSATSDAGAEPVDGGVLDGGDLDGGDGAAPGPTCASGTVAVLAGDDAALTVSVQDRGGAWSGATLAGASRSAPALVATSAGFAGVSRSAGDALVGLAWAGTWSAPTSLVGAATIGAPALAPEGADVHLVFQQPSYKHAYRASSGGAWSTTDEAVQPSPDAGAQSYGPSAPSVAVVGAEVVAAFDGDDGKLYAQSRAAGAWSGATAIPGATVHKPIPPVLVPLEGPSELVVLFADDSTNHVLRHAVRASGAWGSAANTSIVAYTSESFRAARISASTVLVTFRGNDGRPYVMTGTVAGGALAWAAPVPLLAAATTVDGAPAIAKGVCGDDAIAVLAVGGAIQATRLRSGTWTSPESVAGAAGSRVAVATR